MSGAELHLSDPSAWALAVVVSLFVTFFAYGAGPFLYYKFRKDTMVAKDLRVFCIAYTAIVFVLIRVVGWSSTLNISPALLWGSIFHGIYSSKLKKNRFTFQEDDPVEQLPAEQETNEEAETPAPAPVQAEPVQKKVYGPLDPPEPTVKFDRRFWGRAVCALLICALGCLSAYSVYKIDTLETEVERLTAESERLQTENESLEYALNYMENGSRTEKVFQSKGLTLTQKDVSFDDYLEWKNLYEEGTVTIPYQEWRLSK